MNFLYLIVLIVRLIAEQRLSIRALDGEVEYRVFILEKPRITMELTHSNNKNNKIHINVTNVSKIKK